MSGIIKLAAATAVFVTAFAMALPANAQSPFDGFYVGGNLGMSWGDTSARTNITGGSGPVVIPPQDIAAITGATRTGEDGDGGFTGGVQAGYNWTKWRINARHRIRFRLDGYQ